MEVFLVFVTLGIAVAVIVGVLYWHTGKDIKRPRHLLVLGITALLLLLALLADTYPECEVREECRTIPSSISIWGDS